jgi:hypothetical protein
MGKRSESQQPRSFRREASAAALPKCANPFCNSTEAPKPGNPCCSGRCLQDLHVLRRAAEILDQVGIVELHKLIQNSRRKYATNKTDTQ